MLPPSQDEVKEWQTFYPLYFNAEFSLSEGRKVPTKCAVINPGTDEIVAALD
jgi:signal recognition particle subunit SEC65